MLNSNEHQIYHVAILTFISMISTISDGLKSGKSISQHFSYFEQLNFHIQPSMKKNSNLSFRAGIHKMLVKMANKEDPDQTASEEAV